MDELDVVVGEDELPGDPDPFSPESEARLCEQVLGDARHGL
jgi:hypothetical protein